MRLRTAVAKSRFRLKCDILNKPNDETSTPKITSQRGWYLRSRMPTSGMQMHDRDAARREHQSAEHRRIPEQRLQEQRQQRGAAVQHEAEHQHRNRAQHEIPLFQDAEIDHGMLRAAVPKTPPRPGKTP